MVLLVICAVLMGTVGARRLCTARWPKRSPRLGIWAWQGLTVPVLSAVVLAGGAIAVPRFWWDPALGGLVDACWLAVRQLYSTPGGAAATSAGVVLAVFAVTRLAMVVAAEWLSLTWRRSRQRRRLLLLVADRNAPGLLTPSGLGGLSTSRHRTGHPRRFGRTGDSPRRGQYRRFGQGPAAGGAGGADQSATGGPSCAGRGDGCRDPGGHSGRTGGRRAAGCVLPAPVPAAVSNRGDSTDAGPPATDPVGNGGPGSRAGYRRGARLARELRSCSPQH